MLRDALRPLYRALFGERVRAALRPLFYPADTLFRSALWRAAGGRVFSGPFKGLELAPKPFLPHLIGCYERELHFVIEGLCRTPWRSIVNVGGGNGYYIAGLGQRVPSAQLIVFELTAEAREVIAATMERNGLTSRTTILGAAEPANFEPSLAGEGPTLVVMDVEGAEKALADPTVAPSLRHATLLVETHDVLAWGVAETVESRFKATHTVTHIPTHPRELRDWPDGLAPALRRLMPSRCLNAMQEWRGGPQAWLLIQPR